MSSLARISAVLMVRDAEASLAATLDGLKGFAEVVIYDNGSKDKTLEIAGRYPNVRIHKGEFKGFGATRNAAAALAKHDWIFSIDADEVPDLALLSCLDGLSLDDTDKAYDLERQMAGATRVSTTEFAAAIVENMRHAAVAK